jgi:large subunit ribosomal protein L7/L12
MVDLNKIVDDLSALTVLEAAELKLLQTGVSAAAVAAAPAASRCRAGPAAEE